MFLSEGVLSSNISNMNVMNLFLCLFACDNASYNCFNVSAMFLMCVQVYNLSHAESPTGKGGSKNCVVSGTCWHSTEKYFKHKP